MNYKVIITGTTGMVGEGVMLECLAHPQISEVLSVSRRTNGVTHAKLREYLVPDFLNLKEGDETLKGYDACFFCAGVSSIGMKEADYARNTYDTTIHFAQILQQQNPQMVFTYVSGAGTDSTEKGRSMWARVKGRTENALLRMPFKKVHAFRPAFMKAVPGQKHALPMYQYISWMYPILKRVAPNTVSTLQQVAQAMIYCLITGYDKPVLEVSDINRIGKLGS